MRRYRKNTRPAFRDAGVNSNSFSMVILTKVRHMNLRTLTRILKEENKVSDAIAAMGLRPFKTSNDANAGWMWTSLSNDMAPPFCALHVLVFMALPNDKRGARPTTHRRAQMIYNTEAEAFAALGVTLKKMGLV